MSRSVVEAFLPEVIMKRSVLITCFAAVLCCGQSTRAGDPATPRIYLYERQVVTHALKDSERTLMFDYRGVGFLTISAANEQSRVSCRFRPSARLWEAD